MKVPMMELTEQYEQLQDEILGAIARVMKKGQFILGEEVRQLERDVAAYCRVPYGVGVASGSDALHISLLACGVGEGDEVIVPAFTFFATAGAVARCGARPVFVDIDPRTYNIDAGKIEEVVTSRTKAIIPVHLYGQCADMDPILDIASRHSLAVIEDAAQAIGARYKGRSVGESGTTACLSFFPTKNLGAYGDGGMIVCRDGELAEKMRVLRAHGSKPKYYHHVLGYNSRLDELQAAILNVKLKYLDQWADARRNVALAYTERLERLGEFITVPHIEPQNEHVFHQYTIRAKNRDRLKQYLKERGVDTMVYYPKPLHLQPVFAELGYKPGDLPETERACEEVLSLPMYPELDEARIDYVAETIARFYSEET